MAIPSIKRSIVWTFVGLNVCVLLIIGLYYWSSWDQNRNEYSTCPFEPIPDDVPRFITVRERPSDPELLKVFDVQQKHTREYLATEGAESQVTESERNALDVYYADKPIEARRMAEGILRDDPQSIPAMFVRAKVLVGGELHPVRALHQCRVARRFLEQQGKIDPADVIAREWYLRFLGVEFEALEKLGNDTAALRCIELMEQVYQPLPWLKSWPLMRLRRFSEALETLAETEATGNWSSHVMNTRGALEYMTNQRQASYEIFREICQSSKNHIHWKNLGDAALAVGEFAEAEQAYLTAAKDEGRFNSSTAYSELTLIYLQQGRMLEAADALKLANRQRNKRHVSRQNLDQSEIDNLFALLQLLSNDYQRAEEIARRCNVRGFGMGTNTSSKTKLSIRSALVLYMVLRHRIAELDESDPFNRSIFQPNSEMKALEAECWVLKNNMLKLIDNEMLDQMFRPYLENAILPWQVGEVLDVLPTGVAATVIQKTRENESLASMIPYMDAYMTELHWRRGRFQDAINLGQTAIAGLSRESEKLLIARTRLIVAQSNFRLGNTIEGIKWIDPVLDIQPNLLRRLGVSIPVAIEDDGKEISKTIAKEILRSPRIHSDANGLRLVVQSTETTVSINLFRLTDARHINLTLTLDAADSNQCVTELVKQFQLALATPLIHLDQMSIHGIDGSSKAVRDRDVVNEPLEKLRQ